jgi:hypothetical protein
MIIESSQQARRSSIAPQSTITYGELGLHDFEGPWTADAERARALAAVELDSLEESEVLLLCMAKGRHWA